MKKSRYTESQIFQILKEAEAGVPVPEPCRKHRMSSASYYSCKATLILPSNSGQPAKRLVSPQMPWG